MEAAGRRLAQLVRKSEPEVVRAGGGGGGGESYHLSNLDKHVPVIMKSVYFYRAAGELPGGGSSAAAPAVVLRDALARVLSQYYPFTGRLTVTAEGGLAVVFFDGAGVPFVLAAADCDMEDVGDVSAADPAALECLVHADDTKSLFEAPLLTVQVTTFRCGGFALGTATNHCLADGISKVQFLRDWAETARGQLPLSTPPCIDRSMLRPRRPPKVTFPHNEYLDVVDISGIADLYDRQPMSYRHVTFDAVTVARLKQALQAEDAAAAAAGCSTFCLLVALVWRARCRALGMVPAQEAKLIFPVDVRRRLDPPLPAGYFGNGLVFACCACGAGELAARPLSFAARMVSGAVRGVTDEYVRSSIDYIELNKRPPVLAGKFMVSTWTRLGFGTADFGWGEAVQMLGVGLAAKEVALLCRHREEKDGVVLLLGLPASAMETFEELVKAHCWDVKITVPSSV